MTGHRAIREQVPVEDYLKLQKRFAHLFRNPKQAEVIAQLQAIADRNIRRFKLLEKKGAAV